MTTQIAIKLPDDVVTQLDQLVSEGCFHNRSEAVRTAITDLVRRAERRSIDDAYAEGYRRVPQTEEELAEAARLSIESIHEEPWERWW